MSMPSIHSLQVGMPKDHGTEGAEDPMEKPWRTGFYKDPVEGAVYLGRTNLDGDGQANLRHHGGPDKAVCVYPTARYPHWRGRLDRELPFGAFGENFSLDGTDEEAACIGDVYTVGEARVEVSQPRSPCWKLARRWKEKQLAVWFQETGFTGWYLRVLKEGYVETGQALTLEKRPYPEWTIMRANEVRYHEKKDKELAARLAGCEALGASWRKKLRLRAERDFQPDEIKRLLGQNQETSE